MLSIALEGLQTPTTREWHRLHYFQLFHFHILYKDLVLDGEGKDEDKEKTMIHVLFWNVTCKFHEAIMFWMMGVLINHSIL